MIHDLRFYADRHLPSNCIEILITECSLKGNGPTKRVVKSFNIEEVPDNGQLLQPSLRIKREAAQHLLQELWNCGLRPQEMVVNVSGPTVSKEVFDMQTKHLEDMRKMVFEFMALKQ